MSKLTTKGFIMSGKEYSKDQSLEQVGIEDRDSPLRYFSMLPHLPCDLGLDIGSLGVYWHIKRIAGDSGTCFMSVPNMAKQMGISKMTLLKHLKILCSYNEKIGDSFLKKVERKSTNGGDSTSVYSVTPIWDQNMVHCMNIKKENGGSKICTGGGLKFIPKEKPENKNICAQRVREKNQKKPNPSPKHPQLKPKVKQIQTQPNQPDPEPAKQTDEPEFFDHVQFVRTHREKLCIRPKRFDVYKGPDRIIPHQLKILEKLSDADKQKIANRYAEREIYAAIEAATWYRKNKGKIINPTGFLISKCEYYQQQHRG